MPAIRIRKQDGSILEVLVSDEDFAKASAVPWHMAGGKGRVGKYAFSPQLGYLHRWVALRMGLLSTTAPERGRRGRWRVSIDHENGNKLDCQRGNLRISGRSQQMLNPNDGLRSTNRSGYRGVSFVASRERFGKPWMAYVQHHGTSKNLGWYASAEEAAVARGRWDAEHP